LSVLLSSNQRRARRHRPQAKKNTDSTLEVFISKVRRRLSVPRRSTF